MAKIIVLTAAVLAAGAAGISKAIAENPDGATADILQMDYEAKETRKALDDALSVNNLLSEEIETAQAKASEVPDNFTTHSFKNGEDKYGFQFPQMTHKNKVITSQDVVDSRELQAELLEMRSGMIYQKS